MPEAIIASIGRPEDCARCSGVVAVDLAEGADATTGKSTRDANEHSIFGNLQRLIPMISDLYSAPANKPQAAGAMVANDCESIIYTKI
jgi:hypothetical protein